MISRRSPKQSPSRLQRASRKSRNGGSSEPSLNMKPSTTESGVLLRLMLAVVGLTGYCGICTAADGYKANAFFVTPDYSVKLRVADGRLRLDESLRCVVYVNLLKQDGAEEHVAFLRSWPLVGFREKKKSPVFEGIAPVFSVSSGNSVEYGFNAGFEGGGLNPKTNANGYYETAVSFIGDVPESFVASWHYERELGKSDLPSELVYYIREDPYAHTDAAKQRPCEFSVFIEAGFKGSIWWNQEVHELRVGMNSFRIPRKTDVHLAIASRRGDGAK